ncbi:hypothetical protein [Serratia fonticola]
MPIVTVTVSEQIADRTKAGILEEIVNITSCTLNKNEQVTVVKFIEGHTEFFNMGGMAKGIHPFDVEIKITAGTNSKAEKAGWIESIWELMNIYFQTAEHFPCYISIIELDGDSWGFNGMTQYNRALLNQK